MVMGDREKRVFRDILKRVGEFCGVECVTFCVMGNHFHLLAAVRDGKREGFEGAARMGELDAEICRRVGALHGKKAEAALGKEVAALRSGGKDDEAWEKLEPLVKRMNCLATFVRELKWRFSTWYNGENGRVGTLWESRYRSVLVEGSQEALAAIAAYIDLNPVRAGLAEDPKDYRFCGYAEALGGSRSAVGGLRRVVAPEEDGIKAGEVLSRYRLLIFGRGGQRRDGSGRVVRRGVSEESREAVEKAGGVLPFHVLLRGRVRYLTEGAAVGSREFLDRLMEAREGFFPAGRKVSGRPMRGGEWGGLCAVRDVSGAKGDASKGAVA
ncbi:hypothetical protein BH23VER1_BH23VER1_02780 [soil metagenome]